MATGTINAKDMATYAISIPKVDLKRFKGIIKAMGTQQKQRNRNTLR